MAHQLSQPQNHLHNQLQNRVQEPSTEPSSEPLPIGVGYNMCRIGKYESKPAGTWNDHLSFLFAFG